ncbi:MAG: carcinine hydrolase/isopenicillin-N N-acyltransferase family protein [Methanobacterium sp.]
MRKKSAWQKALLYVLALVIILLVGAGFVFRNEIMTVNSIEKVDKYGFYKMEYVGDYGFDEFLKVGASNDKALIEFVSRRLLKGIPINFNGPDLSCSTFNAVTPDGEYIFGRNFDMGYSPAMIVHTKPVNGYESLSMVNLAFLGYHDEFMPDRFKNRVLALAAPYVPLDGINEKGLAVGVLLLPDKPTQQDTKRIDINSTTAIRLLLDKAATVDEAVAMLKKYDMHDSADSCFHYQITDAKGNSAIIEYVNNEMQVLKPEQAYQACTNFYLTPGAKYNLGVGQDRYNIVMNGLQEKNGTAAKKDAMNLLKAARMIDWLDKNTGILYNTQWSAVYDNTHKSVDLCIGQHYEKVYHFSVAEKL